MISLFYFPLRRCLSEFISSPFSLHYYELQDISLCDEIQHFRTHHILFFSSYFIITRPLLSTPWPLIQMAIHIRCETSLSSKLHTEFFSKNSFSLAVLLLLVSYLSCKTLLSKISRTVMKLSDILCTAITWDFNFP